MSTATVEARGLSKRYRISHRASTTTLRELVGQVPRLLSGRAGARPSAESFDALSDVSFRLEGGQALALLGANGSGKSTLLKVLARVVVPSSGSATLTGRVASLLEVGTGFHPDLSGRENVFLNGAILGMPRKRVQQALDSIVAYAGVERFLDTEVKHYSSGMYVRLAFAVAAHVKPDILIVDEALAVGDAEFQAKGLATMAALVRHGGTLLFVSHDMAIVRALATHVLHLEHGRTAYLGTDVAGETARYIEAHTGVSSC